jgi:O-antigen ligase
MRSLTLPSVSTNFIPNGIGLRRLRKAHVSFPIVLFIAFFFPNTRIEPFSESMIAGRWLALFAVAGGILVHWLLSKSISLSSPHRGSLTGLEIMFLLSFSWLGISIVESVNPPLSFSKWGVFLIFSFFCAAYSNLLETKNDLVASLHPFIFFFVGFIWLTPLSTQFYPQRLQSSLGIINGFLVFTNALGHFLTAFGTPAVLFLLARQGGRKKRFLLVLTLVLSVLLTIYSGSRAGTFTSFFILGLALWKWRKDQRFGFLKATLFCAGILFIFIAPRMDQYLFQLLYKYPEQSDILASRMDFWERTLESYHERPLWGSGFGVQQQHAGMPVGFFTIGFREQGSTYYGLLEEVGLLGALPIFMFFFLIAYQCIKILFRSSDPLELFLSRVIFAGLSLAAFENYLLALGNSTSILVILAFFLQQRLRNMARQTDFPGVLPKG